MLGGALDDAGLRLVLTTAGVVVALTFVAAPFHIRQAVAAFEAVDRSWLDASRTLGASEARTLARVAIPGPASPSSRAAATSSSTAADSAKTGNAASSTIRSGLTGSSALISKAVPPPISASRKRSIGKPAAGGWKVNIMIIAEMAASFTPRSPPPKTTATAIARTTKSPACNAPTPTTDRRRSAIATPMATARVSSIARRVRSPTASPSAMTAAIGANVGRSIPRSSTARNQATQAATAVWRIGSHPLLRRLPPERRRWRTMALFSSADTRDPPLLLPT